MRLSERIYNDFLREDLRHESVHTVSYGYLIDLIFEVSDMEQRFEVIQGKITQLDLYLRRLELIIEKLQ